MGKSPDDRPPLVLAFEWTSRITTISLEMVLPGLLGYWLDQWLETLPLFLLLGFALGFGAGLHQLIKLTRSSDQDGPSPPDTRQDPQPRD